MTVNLLQQQQQLQRENLKVSFDHLAGGKAVASGKSGKCCGPLCLSHLHLTFSARCACNMKAIPHLQCCLVPLWGGVGDVVATPPRHFGCRLPSAAAFGQNVYSSIA